MPENANEFWRCENLPVSTVVVGREGRIGLVSGAGIGHSPQYFHESHSENGADNSEVSMN
jgi:hypothetical protein